MKSRSHRFRIPGVGGLGASALFLLILVAPGTPACAEETKPADPNTRAAADAAKGAPAKPKVFTNKDLARYHASVSTGTVVVDVNALQKAKDDAAEPAEENTLPPDEKARRMAELQESIKDLEGKIADLDKRLAFMANPYLPPPQLTPDQIAAQKGMSQKDAYQALQAEKAALAAQAASLRSDLDKVVATPVKARGTAAATNPAAAEAPRP
jgi:cell division protein FtsB